MSTTVNFAIKEGANYNFRAGYRYYPKLATKASVVIDSAQLMFMFENATSNFLGLGALATSVIISMF